jgi:plastocyanin
MVLVVTLTAGSCQRANTAAAPAVSPAAAPAAASTAPAATPTPAAAVGASGGGPAQGSRIVVQLTEEGFVPSRIAAQVGKPVTLAITRKTDRTCAREILFKGQPGKTDLPLDKEVEVTFLPKVSGLVPFGCAMGMMVGGALEVR